MIFLFIFTAKRWEWVCSLNYGAAESLRLNYSSVPPDTKTQKTNGKKLGTYSPTEAVAQPLGLKGKKSIDRLIK